MFKPKRQRKTLFPFSPLYPTPYLRTTEMLYFSSYVNVYGKEEEEENFFFIFF